MIIFEEKDIIKLQHSKFPNMRISQEDFLTFEFLELVLAKQDGSLTSIHTEDVQNLRHRPYAQQTSKYTSTKHLTKVSSQLEREKMKPQSRETSKFSKRQPFL